MGHEGLTPNDVLKRFWGYDDFRAFQKGPVHDLAAGRNVLAVLPTGGGKTVCFQVPALVRGGLCVVVSPLIALMKDQVQGLRKLHLRAELLSAEGGKREAERVLDNAASGQIQVLYLSPERLESELLLARLPLLDIRTIAIDEAHCISQWGHDFRPAYRRIRAFLTRIPGAVVGAFTATATPQVFEDIGQQLGLSDASKHRSPMRRPNLAYSVIEGNSGESDLLKAAGERSGSGLVYVGTRIQAELWAERLRQIGMKAEAFHAGLTSAEKSKRQADWIAGTVQVMACTSAFGMGIDKPDVRWVFHAHLPADLESYVQEAGRAGRDGEPSDCWVFPTQRNKQETLDRLKNRFPSMSTIRTVYQGLANVSSAAPGDMPDQRFPFDTAAWSLTHGLKAIEVLASLSLMHQAGWIDLQEPELDGQRGRAMLLLTPRQASQFAVDLGAEGQLLEALVRSEEKTLQIDLTAWARRLHLPAAHLSEALVRWDRRGWIEWHPATGSKTFRWLMPRQQTMAIALPAEVYQTRQQVLHGKWADMNQFLSTDSCRSVWIDGYFGESNDAPELCGRCDNCLRSSVDFEVWIRQELPRTGRDGFELLAACPRPLRQDLIRFLTEARTSGRIRTEGRQVFRDFA